MNSVVVRIVLIILFLLCLIDFPYGFYQFVRFVGAFGLSYLAYESYQKDEKRDFYILIFLALLFQPFMKISLGRELWNIVDVIVSIYLLVGINQIIKNR